MGEQYMRSLNGDWPGDADRERRKVKDLLAACKAAMAWFSNCSLASADMVERQLRAAIKRAEEG
jgi:hypothetical protein